MGKENRWGISHLGFIPDGNRRWGRKRGIKPAWKAHEKGLEKIEDFLDWCLEAGIPKVSIYTLSTENLNRDPEEVKHILGLIKREAEKILDDEKIHSNQVKVRFLGKLHKLPSRVLKSLKKAMKATEDYQKTFVNFLIAYGGKYELVNSFNKILSKALKKIGKKGKERIEITPKMIQENLLVKEPLDLIIRTGKEHRLSNFMTWQSSYAEIYVSNKLLPDFTKEEFYEALEWYSNRERRFGR